MKRLSMFLLIVLGSMLYGGRESNISSIKRVFSVSSNQVPFLTIPADQFSEDILTRQEDTIKYTDMNVQRGIGLTSGGTFEYGIRLTADELGPYIGASIWTIFWHSYGGSSPNGQVIVYDEGSPTQPGPLITTEPYTGANAPGFYRVDLTNPVLIDSNEKWYTDAISCSTGFPTSLDAGSHVPGKSQWICIDGAWHELTYYNPTWTYNWVMGVIVEDIGGIQVTPAEEATTFGFAPMPNPVRNNVTISYTTVLPGHVSVKVYDRTGLLVKTLVNDVQPAGTRIVKWNSTGISNGVYFMRLETEGNADTHKLILVR